MDVETLARIQFALTVMFHYIYPPLSIGIGLILVIIEGIYLRTRDELYRRMAQFWTRIFALTFAIGVATGIVMEFEFGTNWATYSRFVGDVFGSALAAEGVFAFFLESGFLALLLFGWNRIGPKLHYFATVMVALGAHFSAIWIVVANSWMQTPAGYHIVGEGVGARAEIVSFWEMVFNPSAMTRLSHVIVGAWLAGAFLLISVSAYYLLKKRHPKTSREGIRIGLIVASVALILQAVTGHWSGRVVAEHQPAKLAAFEGLYKTQKGAPAYLFGSVDTKNETVTGVAIPKLLSYLAFEDFDAEVTGLDAFEKGDRPNVAWVFQTYHLMLYTWVIMVLAVLCGILCFRRGVLEQRPWLLGVLTLSVLLPQLGNQAGWVSAEMGRYPWIVYKLMRVPEGLSKTVVESQILGSLIMFTVIYFMLFLLFIYLLDHKIRVGPSEEGDVEPIYGTMGHLMEKKDGN
ncbi:MAG: cytochrome ubiquinol oxidase subunit I [Chlamydiia bacterium]|nr:cytochrome ubiquinol oxidase subunit I [Chlamydiia bacterium]